VTGSTKGNGRAIAELFSAHGSNVVIVGRDEKEADVAASEISQKYKTRPLALRADISSQEDVVRMVKTTLKKYKGRLDILGTMRVFQSKMSSGIRRFMKFRMRM